VIDDFARLSDAEREARIEDIRQQTVRFRRLRPFEFGANVPPVPASTDPLFPIYAFERFDFWSMIDERDAAQALVKGLTADYKGHHVLFANDEVNAIGYDSRALVRLFFPEVTQFNSDMSDSASLISIERARALIGFAPEHSVKAVSERAGSS
jgi:hypothetical protein